MNVSNETIINTAVFNERSKYVLRKIKYFMKDPFNTYSSNINRKKAFENFNSNIIFSKKKYTAYSKINYNCILVCSDKVWNTYFERMKNKDIINVDNNNNIIIYKNKYTAY